MATTKDFRIIFGADHAGFELKALLIPYVKEQGYSVIDCGAETMDSVDYPDYALKVIHEMRLHMPKAFGVLICGSGIGMSMVANRFPGIRAALCTSEYESRVGRQHNDANVLCLGSRVIGTDVAKACLDVFLTTPFLGERHTKRLEKIEKIILP